MKRLLIPLLALLTFVSLAASSKIPAHLVGKTMSVEAAAKKWKQVPFEATRFKNGSTEVRATMVVDLIKKREFIGKTPDEVKSALGEFTGHFWNDYIPTYILNEGWRQNQDTWQLVFLIGRDKRVESLIINKNCCD